jgi:GNAT superfamily N-acetyltransferase
VIEIHQALITDAGTIRNMLVEASCWVDALGVVMWSEGELEPDAIGREVAAGQFVIARVNGVPAGAIRFQEQDLLFWPDVPQDDSAFVHRLVVRRVFKGQGVSQRLLAWSVDRARSLGKRFLRLDCDADRAKLRALYEGAGFQFHSFRQVGPYYVARYQFPLVTHGGSCAQS